MDLKLIRNIAIAFIVYSLFLLVVGRNLSFIPEIKLGQAKKVVADDIRKNVLEKFLKYERKSYSIYYKDLTTGQEFGIDENKVQTGASLNKLPIVAYLYNQAARGRINLEDKIAIQKKDIQDYGTGSIRYGGDDQIYTLKTLTKLALEQSDNTAAYVLSVRLGKGNIQKYADSLGLVATNMENNKTSARDMGRILELIQMRKVTTGPLTLELLDFMKDTDFEDRLARDISKDVAIHHKAADGTGFVHDVGIIDPTSLALRGAGGGGPFILAILTSEVRNQEDTKKTIGKIAKFIYDRGN